MADPDADLLAIGKHCAHESCSQLDFLPFKCSRCSKVYCLEHRVCSCKPLEDTVIICPLCARAVVCPPGSDVELVFDRHTRTECDPANYDKVHRKRRCPVPGCKEKLTTLNEYTCKDCSVTVCLKHRLAVDHDCKGRAAAASSAARSHSQGLQSLRRMFGALGGTSGTSVAATAGKAQARSQAQPAVRTAAPSSSNQRSAAAKRPVGSAATARENVQAQLQQYRQQQRQRAQPGESGGPDTMDLTSSPARPALRSPAAAAASGTELCHMCGARFATVQQLIEHAEAAHSGGWSSGALNTQQQQQQQQAGGRLERCPHCGREFADAVQLVAHVEQQHAAASATTCVCS